MWFNVHMGPTCEGSPSPLQHLGKLSQPMVYPSHPSEILTHPAHWKHTTVNTRSVQLNLDQVFHQMWFFQHICQVTQSCNWTQHAKTLLHLSASPSHKWKGTQKCPRNQHPKAGVMTLARTFPQTWVLSQYKAWANMSMLLWTAPHFYVSLVCKNIKIHYCQLHGAWHSLPSMIQCNIDRPWSG